MMVLHHHDTALTPARYVGYTKQEQNDDIETTCTETTPQQEPKVYFERAPSTITPRCYTFNNKR